MAKSSFFVASAVFLLFLLPSCNADPAELSGELEANSKLFREYIGALFNGVKFTDVPINPRVKFHFILAFAIDYTTSESPTNGKFNIFWDKGTLTPAAVKAIKDKHKNVKVAVSLGGDSVGKSKVVFNPTSVSSWVNNAVASLTKIIKEYHLDGIDIDYEHFATSATPDIFANSIGQLIAKLKQQKVISFASIAPFDAVQKHYVALWNKHAKIINYVNFQFYTYPSSITVPEFIKLYNEKASLYKGGRVLVSFSTDSRGGLTPEKGFFNASRLLKKRGKLAGIFVWSADSSKVSPVKFRYEKEAQELLAAKSSEITFGFGEGDHEEQNIDLSSEITSAEGDDEEQNINLSSEITSAEGDDEEQNIDLSSEITFGERNDEEQSIRLPSEITSAERDDEEQRIIL